MSSCVAEKSAQSGIGYCYWVTSWTSQTGSQYILGTSVQSEVASFLNGLKKTARTEQMAVVMYRYGISCHCLQFHFLLHSSFYTSTMYMQSNQIDYVLFHTYLMLIAAIHGIIISFFIPFHFISFHSNKAIGSFPVTERTVGGRAIFCPCFTILQ